jgi:hypothetical protein
LWGSCKGKAYRNNTHTSEALQNKIRSVTALIVANELQHFSQDYFDNVRRICRPKGIITLNPLCNILISSSCHTSYWIIILSVNKDFSDRERQSFSRNSWHASYLANYGWAWRALRLELWRKTPLLCLVSACSERIIFWNYILSDKTLIYMPSTEQCS